MSLGQTIRAESTDSHGSSSYAPFIHRPGIRRLRPTSQFAAVETGNSILDGLSREMTEMIEPFLNTSELSKERVLFQEEDRLQTIYFPLTAVISEFRSLEDGRMVEIAVSGNEGAIGLSTLLSGSQIAHNYTQVSQAGRVSSISANNLDHLLKSNDALRFELGRHTDAYIRQISQKAICNMYHSVKERICTWLLMIQDRSGRSSMTLTHEQISRSLGVNRPSVSRMAHELLESNLISYSRGQLKIRDRDRVERSACTCYFELASA